MTRTDLLRLTRASLLGATILGGTMALPMAGAEAANLPLPDGQYITPTAINGSVQQLLNPGLAAYPNFVAGEAVRSQLSPDGTTLAIICAGQNSLVGPQRRDRCGQFHAIRLPV